MKSAQLTDAVELFDKVATSVTFTLHLMTFLELLLKARTTESWNFCSLLCAGVKRFFALVKEPFRPVN